MTIPIRLLSIALTTLLSIIIMGRSELAVSASNKIKPQKATVDSSRWSRTFTTFTNYPATVIGTSDGGYLITGTRLEGPKTSNSFLWFLKTDRNGRKLWEKTVGARKNSSHSAWASNNRGYAAVETSDGYLATGIRDLSAQHGGSAWNELWVVKLAKNGSLLWEKAYGCRWGTSSSAGEGRSIIEPVDGGILVAGTGSIGGATEAWLLRLDKNGNRLWEKFLGSSDETVSVAKTPDGHFYAALTTPDNHAVIMRLDSSGTILWRHQINQYQRSSLGSISASGDGGVILAGSGDSYGLLVKFSPAGSLLWHKTFAKQNAKLMDVKETPDKGFMAVGGASSGTAHLLIIKTDGEGKVAYDQEITDRQMATGQSLAQSSDGGFAGIALDDRGTSIKLFRLKDTGTMVGW